MADVMKLLNEEGVLRVPVTDHGLRVGVISRADRSADERDRFDTPSNVGCT